MARKAINWDSTFRTYAVIERKNGGEWEEVNSTALCHFATQEEAELYINGLSEEAASSHAEGCICAKEP